MGALPGLAVTRFLRRFGLLPMALGDVAQHNVPPPSKWSDVTDPYRRSATVTARERTWGRHHHRGVGVTRGKPLWPRAQLNTESP